MKKLLFTGVLLTSLAAKGQYLHDQFTTHEMQYNMHNVAIYKDERSDRQYHILQHTENPNEFQVSLTDEDFNIQHTFVFKSPNSSASFSARDINEFSNMPDDPRMIVVGDVIIEGGNGHNGFMMCYNKNDGTVNWFKLFPGAIYFNAVEISDKGAIAVGYANDIPPVVSTSHNSGIIVSVDPYGNFLWGKQVEGNKYLSGNFNLAGHQVLGNSLEEITHIGGNMFAAVGCVDYNQMWFFNDVDGDASVVLFDQDGNSSSLLALGNVKPVEFGGKQRMQTEWAQDVTYDASDNSLVIVGYESHYTETEPTTACPPPPVEATGLWVTKLDLNSLTPIWSKVFTVPDVFGTGGPIFTAFQGNKCIYDNAGNNSVLMKGGNGLEILMKLDANGDIIYARTPSLLDWSAGLADLTTGFDQPDVVATGSASFPGAGKGLGLNWKAFDNIQEYCMDQPIEVPEEDNEYDVFNISEGYFNPPSVDDHLDPDIAGVDNFIVCDRIQAKRNNVAEISEQQVQVSNSMEGNTVNIQAGAEIYSGTIVNSLGQIIKKLDRVQGNVQVDMQGNVPGVYYLHLSNTKNRVTKAIVVR